jgi:hypothetical protein
LSCFYESETELIDSILWGNMAVNGSQIAVGGVSDPNLIPRPAELAVSYCDVQGWAYPNDPNCRIDSNAVFVEPNGILDWDCNSIINADPCFVDGYYLSQPPDQNVTSLCVDRGSDYADNVGLGGYVTSTAGVNDVCEVDLGYHYSGAEFCLTVDVPDGKGTVDPCSGCYSQHAILTLTAQPDPGYRVKGWYDQKGILLSEERTLEVLMNSDMLLTVEFELMRTFHVPGQYGTIQAALTDTEPDGSYTVRSGDKVVLSAQVYYEHSLDFDGRSITIASEYPDDPCVVAGTIIDCGGGGRAFIFRGGEGPDAVIDGLTIRNGDAIGNSSAPRPPHPGVLGSNGEDAFGGAILSFGASSPIISNCIIENCIARGRYGGDGADMPSNELGPGPRGGDGGQGGDGYGGAFYFAAGSGPTIRGCRIINCRAIGGNGGRGGRGGDGTRLPLAPEGTVGGGTGGNAGNGGNAYGGVMYFEPDCVVTIENCIISDCDTTQGEGNTGGDGGDGLQASDLGGGGGSGSLNGMRSWYGAIHYGPRCEVDVSDTAIMYNAANTTVTRNDWPGGNGGVCLTDPNNEDLWGPPGATPYSWTLGFVGGSYYGTGCTVELANCIINYQTADGTGGAAEGGAEYYESYCTAVISDCNFVNNFAGTGGAGGAQRFGEFCSVQVDDCNFFGNYAGVDGGSQRFGRSCVVEFDECNFTYNYASNGGALFFLSGCSLDIDSSNFSQNLAYGSFARGGAV